MAYPCEAPRAVRYEAAQLHLRVRCRRCKSCLEARRHLWVIRAAREQVKAKQTWFLTLTFGGKRRAAIMSEASRMDMKLSQPDRLSRAAGWFVSKFFKRLRKAGFEVRYLVVFEPHADGFPHIHALLHDQRGDLRWSHITAQWSAGFSMCKLVRDAGAIRYVTKYLAKGRYGKIRASGGYGADPEGAANSVSVLTSKPVKKRAREKEGKKSPKKEGKEPALS